jgi:sterol desaturase/sphingolipid hydroxylase (fatty acid hydroxylase superfamily)
METELLWRMGSFLTLFALFAGLEALVPRRVRNLPRGQRWPTNLAITVLNTVALRALAVVLPLLAIGAALDAQAQGWGLLNRQDWPAWVELVLAILILDLAIWAQHLVTHKVPLFWRFHRVHHADRDMDVTTGFRFHPVEILASMGLKIGLISARPLGAGGSGVRDPAQQHGLVQSCEPCASGAVGPCPAAGPCHPRHAPGASFHPPRGA